jgi:hypothetical protein
MGGGDNISKPSPPYYYKKESDTYHWESSCSKNNFSVLDENWERTWSKPSGKEQCNECKGK